MSTSANSNETSLTLNLSVEHQQTLENAAAITGLSLHDYVLHQALQAAIAHIASYSQMAISDREKELLMAALANSPSFNEVWKEAIKESHLKSENHNLQAETTEPETDESKHLHDLAKAILVNFAWSYADALEKNKSTTPTGENRPDRKGKVND